MKAKRSAGLFLLLVFLGECSVRPPVITLPRGPVDRIEGYASLSLNSAQVSSRGKVSFVFSLPQKGRMEGFGPLGRSLYQIVIEEESGVFIFPSKKVYWRGRAEEIVEKFLGFPLRLDEMIGLLTGRWDEVLAGRVQAPSGPQWILDKDREGKVLSGRRDEVRFEIKEFFGGTGVPRILLFKNSSGSGRLKILRIGFNRPLKSRVFDLTFLEDYQSKSWTEIETIIRDEN